MKYAVVQTGAKQYKVKEGDRLLVEKLEGKEGDKLDFDQVLLISDKDKKKIGQPITKGEKIRVATYKAKSRYRKVKGHRQQLTEVAIEKIFEKKKSSTRTRKK
jgi:large subunit ribosomal protein L21